MLSEALVAHLIDEMKYELDRVGPPEGFPEFHDVPSGRYTSHEFYDLEQETLFKKSWIIAGRVEDLPEAGSYFLFDELGMPLIVIRGQDDVIRCFSNTCRHRGAPVVREPRGQVRHLRCQYHAWTYGITKGDLVAVTDERDFIGLRKEDRALPEVSCDTWGGFVWVNVDPNAIPLLDFLGPIPEEMEHFQMDDLRLVGTDHRVIDCNWKVAVEAFQEVYHFRFIHDRGGFTLLDTKGAAMGLFKHGNSRMVVPHSKQVVATTEGRTGWDDIREFPGSYGLPVIPGVHPLVHSTSYSFTIFPNVITPVAPIGFPVMLFFPISPSQTHLRIYHYGPNWGDGEPPKGWEDRFASYSKIIDEDIENMNPMYRAMLAPNFGGVPLSYQERRIWHFNETIDRVIGVERIPEDLRVKSLLDPFIEVSR